MTKAVKNAVVFVRGADVRNQLDLCKAYTEEKGYKVAGVILGKGKELKEVIAGLDIKVDVVVTKDVTRISRNSLEYFQIHNDLLTNHGCVIESAVL